MIFNKYKICFWLLVSLFFYSHVFGESIVRVLLDHKTDQISVEGTFSIWVNNRKINTVVNGPVSIGKTAGKQIYLKNESNGFIKIGKNKYKGNLNIVRSGSIQLINHVDIEEYIKGVLPNEISPKWPIEVIKAQAVAARTFAYSFLNKNKEQNFDVTDNTFSQVYKGCINENIVFNKAIEKTKGEVLTYNNEPIQALFHAACGGYTECADKVWGKPLPYLKGVPCPYCTGSPHYKWEAVFTQQEIINKLKKKGHVFEEIRAIHPDKKSHSGRWTSVKIIGRRKTVVLQGNEFRILLGSTRLKSMKLSGAAQRRGDKFIFRGKGWGHGAGLCQWGAKHMAEKGYKYYQILRYYYRSTKLTSIKSKFLKKR